MTFSLASLRRPSGRRLAALLAIAAAAGGAACAEQLDGGANCPALCPTVNATVLDTLLDAVALDTTLTGFPAPGDLSTLLLATRTGADSLDVRAVVRFDALPARYFPPAGGDSLPITRVDSSFLRLRVDTTGLRAFPRAVTLEAFDVDTAFAVDTAAAALAPLFRADRRIGSVVLPAGFRADSIRLPISNAVVGQRVQGTRRLRIGLRLVTDSAVTLRIGSTQGALAGSSGGPRLTFDPATDTVFSAITVAPLSFNPQPQEIAARLRDFSFVVRAPRAALGADLVVGGAPATRVFVRFAVPPRLVDSTTIVRATLELVQRPARGLDARDSVTLRADAVLATDTVLDPRRAADFTARGVTSDTLRLSPADSGRRALSIVNLARAWRTLPTGTQRAITLRAGLEGAQAGELRFFSREAAAMLRPRLRLSYIPRTDFGLP